jgi:50S ribosomal subunit-associated GTPase HflX
VWLSSQTGAGTDLLLGVIAEYLHTAVVRCTVDLGVQDARVRALLYARGAVASERLRDDGGWQVDLELERQALDEILRREHLTLWQPDGAAGRLERAAVRP